MAFRAPPMWPLVAVLSLLATAVLVPAAGASHQGSVNAGGVAVSTSVTLNANNWTAYTFDMTAGDVLTYDVRVTAGTEIDVYLVPDVGLAEYASDSSVQFLEYGDVTNQRNISGSLGQVSGVVAVIIDNTDVGQGGANPTGPVAVSVNLTRTSNLFLGGVILLACGVALLVVAGVVAFVLQRRKAAALPAPPDAHGPPPQPYQTPPPGQSPTPPPAVPPDAPPPSPPPGS